jgi:transposase-like protein
MRDLVLKREDLLTVIQQQIHDFQHSLALLGMKALLDFEIETLCGKVRERSPGRKYVRFGRQTSGHLVVGDQKVSFRKPRIRTKDGKNEVELTMYNRFKNGMREDVFKKMLYGVSTRNYELAINALEDGYGIERSSVSRRFVAETTTVLKQLSERPIDRYYPVVYIDGFPIGGEMMIVALGIGVTAQKQLISMRQGKTENAEVVKSMFDELENRGFLAELPRLFVIDGSKALYKAIIDRFPRAFIQRCQVHKARNILGHLEKHACASEVQKRLHEAYNAADYETARQLLHALMKDVDAINPDAGASIREGLDETLTVFKLTNLPLLAKTLRTTNPIESLNSMLDTFSARVKYWRGGTMRKRWLAAAAIESEKRMRRVRGYRGLSYLIDRMCELTGFDMKTLDKERTA